MKRLISALFAVGVVMAPLSAQATSGPGCLVVVNVPNWDVLNMRAGPSARNPIVDHLPPGRHGIVSQSGPCIPRNVSLGARWCPVAHYNGNRTTSGWVKRRFVSPSQCP